MYKILVILSFFIITNISAKMMEEGTFVKEKQELIKLKNELDEFYKIKEKEYKINKNKLLALDKDIQEKLDQIEKTKKENQRILDEINLTISSKAMTMYGKMKIKIVKNILEEKIKAGQINEVFDIIIRLKNKRVMELLKKFDTKTSTKLMDMLNNYKENKLKEK
jgi:hypothetical protein